MYNPNKDIFLNPNIEYLFDKRILEYDIHTAGLNIIKELKLLPESKIDQLSKMEKSKCHVMIGKLQRDDKEFSKKLSNGFAEMRKRFIINNNLQDNDIISVKKDAFFVTKECIDNKFGFVEFVIKNKYSSYIRLVNNSNIEFYYSDTKLDIKGMSTISENKHRAYMIEFIRKYFNLMESRNSSIKRYLINFIKDYKEDKLEDEYYLEFNNKSYQFDKLFNYQNLIIPFIQICISEGI